MEASKDESKKQEPLYYGGEVDAAVAADIDEDFTEDISHLEDQISELDLLDELQEPESGSVDEASYYGSRQSTCPPPNAAAYNRLATIPEVNEDFNDLTDARQKRGSYEIREHLGQAGQNLSGLVSEDDVNQIPAEFENNDDAYKFLDDLTKMEQQKPTEFDLEIFADPASAPDILSGKF